MKTSTTLCVCVSVLVASLAFIAAPARAADFPIKAPVYAPYAPVIPLSIWSGFYIGANLGYGWANVGDSGGVGGTDMDGFLGGAQLGYNWQVGRWVFGLEGDFQGSSQKDSVTGTVLGIPFTVEQKLPWFATTRARIGYAFDSVMLYATGGAAWANYKLSVSALGTTVSDDTTKIAWTIGGGVEWMFLPRWSTKLEYLYIDTGDTSTTLFGVSFDARAKEHIVRLGVNYHF